MAGAPRGAMAMATDMRAPLSSSAVEAASCRWLHEPFPWHGFREAAWGMAAVRKEAQLFMEVIRYTEVFSEDEIRRTFSATPTEVGLTAALLAGGVAGRFDLPQTLAALRAASDAGSVWAPLWLGDFEQLRLWDSLARAGAGGGGDGEGSATSSDGSDGGCASAAAHEAMETRRRGWYELAASRGHPEAVQRLISQEVLAPAWMFPRTPKAEVRGFMPAAALDSEQRFVRYPPPPRL